LGVPDCPDDRAANLVAREENIKTITFNNPGRRNALAPETARTVAAGFGCSLALVCDITLASTRVKFIEVFVNIALIPDGGSTYIPCPGSWV